MHSGYTNMDYNWNDLRIFLAAARSGSLSAASRILECNQPTVSRRISALEQAIGLRLFQRHAHGLTLTEDGQRILRVAVAMDAAAAALQRHTDTTSMVNGTVRIAAPEGLGLQLLAPALNKLLHEYPELTLILESASSSADLTRGEADIAVRLYRPDAPDLVVRRVRNMAFGLYASPPYLSQYGTPTTADALLSHRFIDYGELLSDQSESRWLQSLAPSARYVLRSDSIVTRINAAQAGTGIAVLPHVLTRNTELVQILADHAPPDRTIWLVVHQDLRDAPRMRVVLDFLTEVIESA